MVLMDETVLLVLMVPMGEMVLPVSMVLMGEMELLVLMVLTVHLSLTAVMAMPTRLTMQLLQTGMLMCRLLPSIFLSMTRRLNAFWLGSLDLQTAYFLSYSA